MCHWQSSLRVASMNISKAAPRRQSRQRIPRTVSTVAIFCRISHNTVGMRHSMRSNTSVLSKTFEKDIRRGRLGNSKAPVSLSSPFTLICFRLPVKARVQAATYEGGQNMLALFAHITACKPPGDSIHPERISRKSDLIFFNTHRVLRAGSALAKSNSAIFSPSPNALR